MRTSQTWFTSQWIGASALIFGACVDIEYPAGPYRMHADNATPDEADASEGTDSAQDADAPQGVDAAVVSDGSAPEPGCIESLIDASRATINLCRSCHVRLGLAGRSRFLLTGDTGADEANLRAAFDMLGDELLAMPSEQGGRDHGGGKLLEEGSASYRRWEALVRALAAPESACD